MASPVNGKRPYSPSSLSPASNSSLKRARTGSDNNSPPVTAAAAPVIAQANQRRPDIEQRLLASVVEIINLDSKLPPQMMVELFQFTNRWFGFPQGVRGMLVLRIAQAYVQSDSLDVGIELLRIELHSIVSSDLKTRFVNQLAQWLQRRNSPGDLEQAKRLLNANISEESARRAADFAGFSSSQLLYEIMANERAEELCPIRQPAVSSRAPQS